MAPGSGEAKHVLVVDDSEEIIQLLREIFGAMGHRVSATTSPPRDVDEVRRIDPDLLFLDLMVGAEGSGWELLQKLTMSREMAGMPIIVCAAALPDVPEQGRWLASKGVKTLLKPFSLDDLELAVNRALRLEGPAATRPR
jgi:DNA-binding response OmpR family regulator